VAACYRPVSERGLGLRSRLYAGFVCDSKAPLQLRYVASIWLCRCFDHHRLEKMLRIHRGEDPQEEGGEADRGLNVSPAFSPIPLPSLPLYIYIYIYAPLIKLWFWGSAASFPAGSRTDPSGNRVQCILTLKSDTGWQQFLFLRFPKSRGDTTQGHLSFQKVMRHVPKSIHGSAPMRTQTTRKQSTL